MVMLQMQEIISRCFVSILEKIKETRLKFFQGSVTTKIRNAFDNNISADIKLSKAQISKIIQSGGSFGS